MFFLMCNLSKIESPLEGGSGGPAGPPIVEPGGPARQRGPPGPDAAAAALCAGRGAVGGVGVTRSALITFTSNSLTLFFFYVSSKSSSPYHPPSSWS